MSKPDKKPFVLALINSHWFWRSSYLLLCGQLVCNGHVALQYTVHQISICLAVKNDLCVRHIWFLDDIMHILIIFSKLQQRNWLPCFCLVVIIIIYLCWYGLNVHQMSFIYSCYASQAMRENRLPNPVDTLLTFTTITSGKHTFSWGIHFVSIVYRDTLSAAKELSMLLAAIYWSLLCGIIMIGNWLIMGEWSSTLEPVSGCVTVAIRLEKNVKGTCKKDSGADIWREKNYHVMLINLWLDPDLEASIWLSEREDLARPFGI